MRQKAIGWIASTFSLTGVILNALYLPICWGVWCIANLLWMYWAYKKREWSQVILWIAFTIANIYGWYKWTR